MFSLRVLCAADQENTGGARRDDEAKENEWKC